MKRTYTLGQRAEATAATRARVLKAAAAFSISKPIVDVTLEEIAAEAGTTVRTVLRLFEGKESLFREALLEGARKGFGDLVEPGNVTEFVGTLCSGYEEFGDAVVRRVADARQLPALREQFETGRRSLSRWVERSFSPQLAEVRGARRDELLASLIVLADVQVWKILRRDQKLPREKVENVLRNMIAAQLKGVEE